MKVLPPFDTAVTRELMAQYIRSNPLGGKVVWVEEGAWNDTKAELKRLRALCDRLLDEQSRTGLEDRGA